jgi:Protein of unknown function (DUF429)
MKSGAKMKILGIDFTSRPSSRKPITCLRGHFANGVLTAEALLKLPDFPSFEATLREPGPWIAGLDFPFGLSQRFIENIGWPKNWEAYVQYARSLGRDGFREALENYKKPRPYGDKEHLRKTDSEAGAISPQKLFGVPVALMFFEGASRLLEADVNLPGIRPNGSNRIAVETYPGGLVRHLLGQKKPYKQDDKKKQTQEQEKTRSEILSTLQSPRFQNEFKFAVSLAKTLATEIEQDATGDLLDALLCAILATHAWNQKDQNFGAPTDSALEGWIVSPPKAAK